MPRVADHNRIGQHVFINHQTYDLFTDFADYSGLSPKDLASMYIEEQKDIFENIGFEDLARLHILPRRVFPGYTDLRPRSARLYYRILRPTLDLFEQHAQRIGVDRPWIARVAIMNGLALEMESEKYVPEPLSIDG